MSELRRSPLPVFAVVRNFVALLAVLGLGSCGLSVWKPLFWLNENQILYLFSTSAQVIAAIYGLTLTGFVFFRNELSREEIEDETLSEAIEELKSRYFSLLVFITVLVAITLILANLAISCEGQNSVLLTMAINGGQAAFFTSLAAIAYFIFDVISPHRIEEVSRGIQKRIDPVVSAERKGSLEDFLSSYNEIEQILQSAGKAYTVNTSGHFRRHFANSRIAEVLFRRQVISEQLYGELLRLITLRNSIIHGAEPAVSTSMVANAQQVLARLKECAK